nr:DinB family protein [Caldalkalibacillus salinus]
MSNAVNTLRDVLLHEMEVGIKSSTNLIKKVKEEHWDYQPADHMNSLRHLMWHLVSIPEVDLTIMQEKGEGDVRTIEGYYKRLETAEDLAEEMYKGFEKLKTYMTSLSDEAFLNKETTAFYSESGHTQATWLTETATHIFHHRAQLFNYMKQLDYDVNMFDLYVSV